MIEIVPSSAFQTKSKKNMTDVAEIQTGPSKHELDELASHARNASDFLKAISHETRLLILCMLVDGERTVSELEAGLGLQQAVVSQQLARLRLEQLVQTRREGRQIFYSIAKPEITNVIGALYNMFCKPQGAEA
jgi:ArsR family transcriptional regulator, virulence genes transcriptional regulator